MLGYFALAGAFIIAGIGFGFVFGKASRLGHGDERENPRSKDPLDIDTEFL